MQLIAKFNFVLIAVFAVGFVAVCGISKAILERDAMTQVTQQARVMIDTGSAMRDYTDHQIDPILAPQLKTRFLPQAITAFATQSLFTDLRQHYPMFTYREAALNPTDLKDRATDWEADVIEAFQNNRNLTEVSTVRSSAMGRTLVLCHPIRIADEACLKCHGSSSVAPASMIKHYGTDHGFGWHMGDIVAAQIVTVPTTLPDKLAHQAFEALVGSLIGVFVATLLALNLMMRVIILRPVGQLSYVADEISKGHVDVEDIPVKGKDEIARLTSSFNRMQRSLKKAMSMLDDA